MQSNQTIKATNSDVKSQHMQIPASHKKKKHVPVKIQIHGVLLKDKIGSWWMKTENASKEWKWKRLKGKEWVSDKHISDLFWGEAHVKRKDFLYLEHEESTYGVFLQSGKPHLTWFQISLKSNAVCLLCHAVCDVSWRQKFAKRTT